MLWSDLIQCRSLMEKHTNPAQERDSCRLVILSGAQSAESKDLLFKFAGTTDSSSASAEADSAPTPKGFQPNGFRRLFAAEGEHRLAFWLISPRRSSHSRSGKLR